VNPTEEGARGGGAPAVGDPAWEARAFRREEEDPRRRATVSDRLTQELASQLPAVCGLVAALFLGIALWHLVSLGTSPTPGAGLLALASAVVALLLAGGALWTRRDPGAVASAHMVAFGVSVLVTSVAFLHLLVSGNPAHGVAFPLLILGSAAFFQDGLRLAVAVAMITTAWIVGLVSMPFPPEVLPPMAAAMAAAAGLAVLVSTSRVRSLRRLEALNLELQAQIGLDALTGIANRRAFHDRLQAIWDRLAGEGQPLALLLVDLDHFKNLNDTRGHAEGDAALRQMGGVLRMAVRSTEDLPARLGGEEFAVLLPRTIPDHALLVAERIRTGVAQTTIPNPGASTGETLTTSVGVAMAWPLPDGVGGPRDLLRRADAALYLAKSKGRNRVVLDQSARKAAEAMEPSPLLPEEPSSP
jgi:diguanylate cyclase (GGDEF)-like protein